MSQSDTSAPESLRMEIRQAIQSMADADYAIRDFVPTEGEVLGVRVPQIRAFAKAFKTEHKDLKVDSAAALLDLQVATRSREESLFGIFFLASYRRDLTPRLWVQIERWVDCIDNWEVCDQLAMNIVSEIVARQMALVDELVEWAKSPNQWRRRCALAAAASLNQKGRSHPQETLRICGPLMADSKPNVQKAIGWAIREATEHDETAIFDFLLKHKAITPRRVLREASQKLPAEQRAALLDS